MMLVRARTPRHLLRDSVVLQTKTDDASPGRSPSEAWSNVSTIACAIQPLSGSKAVQAGVQRGVRAYTVYVDPALHITGESRLVWTDTSAGQTRTRYLRVVTDRDMVAGGVLRELDCEEVDGLN